MTWGGGWTDTIAWRAPVWPFLSNVNIERGFIAAVEVRG